VEKRANLYDQLRSISEKRPGRADRSFGLSQVAMIRVVMFDLGMTLIDDALHLFSHVEDALAVVSNFETADDEPLRSCLVSDFKMPAPPGNTAKITELFHEYLEILDQAGLRIFFEPVEERVTLSTHAGVHKPDRRIFETALQRLGVAVPLDDCLLITENAAHIEAARTTFNMKTLQFRSTGSAQFDFDSWADAPALIANLVAPQQPANMHGAIKAHLAAQGVDLVKAEPAGSSGTMKFVGQVWSPISVPGHHNLQNVQVPIQVEGEVIRGPKGQVRSFVPLQPSADQLAEATSFVRSLATHGQIAGQAAARSLGAATHEIETDKLGNRRLVRKRFSAF
jgi:phosphoglycolate phosphatase-like HAD superfamily hydrolase